MNHRNTVAAFGDPGEIRIDQAIRHLGRDEIARTVHANAARLDVPVDDRHLAVIRSLIEHYRHDGVRRHMLTTEHRMRVLDEAYAFLGGADYLHALFGVADEHALLARIHRLAGLPAVEDADDFAPRGSTTPSGPPVSLNAG